VSTSTDYPRVHSIQSSQRESTRENTQSASNIADRFTRSLLKKQMALSIRNHTWFRLNRLDRSLYGLAVRLNVRLQSVDLLRALVSVLKKLQQLGDTLYSEMLVGTRMAWSFSEAACSWGNFLAKAWRSDQSYIRFLGRLYSGRDYR